MEKLNASFQRNILDDRMLEPWADDLGVSIRSLRSLGVGIYPLTGAITFPERDAKGKVIGISQRQRDGKKFMIKKSKRGLIYPFTGSKGGNYESGKQNWKRVGKGISCPVCGKGDGCLVDARNIERPAAVVCVHISEGSVKPLELGHLHILRPEGNVNVGGERALPVSTMPIIVVEGASDTATALDMGFVAVGRPSAQGKNKDLADLLRGLDIIVIGDNDAGVGKTGMESTFQALKGVCKSVIKVLPPPQYGDLRQWKNQISLTAEQLLEWVEAEGDKCGDPNLLNSDAPLDLARHWLDSERTQDALPLIRCYKGQWLEFMDGCYREIDTGIFRGSIYSYLAWKKYRKVSNSGEISVAEINPDRHKVTNIIDALNTWCPVTTGPPSWFTDGPHLEPRNLIAFRNGMLDVEEYLRGKIVLHDPTPAYFNLNVIPYDFVDGLESQLLLDTVSDIFDGDQEKIDLCEEWFGYNLTPDMSLEKLMMLKGGKRAGKGTIITALVSMLGRNQCTSTSLQHLSSGFGYQSLTGKLAAILGDTRVSHAKEAISALEKILQIVGRDPIIINRKYLSCLDNVYLSCRFTAAMNEFPRIPDHANALEARTCILKFDKSYLGHEDTSLKLALKNEAVKGAFVAFALRGLKRLRKNGRFTVPESEAESRAELQQLSNPVMTFVEDYTEVGIDYFEPIDTAYQAWCEWCERAGMKPGNKISFGMKFTAAIPNLGSIRMQVNEFRRRVYTGVKLTDECYRDLLGVIK